MPATLVDHMPRPAMPHATTEDTLPCRRPSAHVTNALLDRVWHQATAHPTTPVFRSLGQRPVSYAQLWRLSSSLAVALASERADRAPVMVVGAKSALTVAAFLACLRTGHAYAPVDSSMPARRVNDIADQLATGSTRPTMLLTAPVSSLDADIDLAGALDAQALASLVDNGTCPLARNERASWVHGEDTQYIIFTSGSTGRPKGIEVTAADVENFMAWMGTFPLVSEGGKTFLDQAPYSFDLSVYELVGALSTGGCLYALSADAAHDYALLFRELADSQADVWVSTPPFADLCLVDHTFGQSLLPQLGLFLFCGDTLTHRTARGLRERFPHARLANTYGPTESTVAVTYCEIDDRMIANPQALPVGVARPGTELHIMRSTGPEDALVAECAPGESGEIVICGDTVAKGYLNDPQKTSHAFGAGVLADGTPARAFRTGDIGYLDEDGMLHYEGRMDSLVKVNGFRIELGDVENHLTGLAGVKGAAVVPVMRDGHVSSLRAFVVLDHHGPTPDELPRALRARLARSIPSYMVPRTVRILSELPLTANAKIDRTQLMAG